MIPRIKNISTEKVFFKEHKHKKQCTSPEIIIWWHCWARFQKKIKKIDEYSTKGGGGQRWVDFPLREKEKKCKDDQNGIIRPENRRLKFFINGGQVKFSG